MKRPLLVGLLVLLTAGLVLLAVVMASALPSPQMAGTQTWTATLSGFSEVPPKFITSTGSFEATFVTETLHYTLTLPAMSSPVTAAHIHFGQPGVNGGIVAFLCGGGGKRTCPAGGGTVTGTIRSANVLAVAPQGVQAGDFAAFRTIVTNGLGYANAHTAQFPDGIMRGQILPVAMGTPGPLPSPSATFPVETPMPIGTPIPVGTPVPMRTTTATPGY